MSYCKYHPLSPAAFLCEFCNISVCRHCVDEGDRGDHLDCILCQRKLEVQAVTSESGVPFWRRLQESFRYPLNWNSLTLIFAFAFFSAVLESSKIFSIALFGIYLAMLGAVMKYCFVCLEHTSLGEMKAPDITEAYGGGFQTLGHLFVMILFLVGVVAFVGYFLGQALAGLTAVLLVMGFPAVLINYALSGSLASALNLTNMVRLISTIGLPYGLLIAFIMIMSGSVGVIHEIIGERFSFASAFLQNAVTWYYQIVIFHIMGYMIFQYQDRLGYVAHSSEDQDGVAIRSKEENLIAKINVFLKEGELTKVIDLFENGCTIFPDNDALLQRYFDFLIRTRNKRHLNNCALQYLNMLVKRNRFDKMGFAYKQVITVNPDYFPEEPDLRFYVARASLRSGDSLSAIKLIRGLHKTHPQFEYLIEAYEVMYEAMQNLPSMQDQLSKCQQLLQHLRSQLPQEQTQIAKPRKVAFEASDLSASMDSVVVKGSQLVEVEVESECEGPKDLPPIEFKP